MKIIKSQIFKASLAALFLASFSACDNFTEGEAEESEVRKSAGTSRAITKADRNPEVELILDEMNYIGVGEGINIILAADVLFQSEESDVLAREHQELDQLGRLLEYYPDARLSITAYAPDATNAQESKRLAQARADAVKNYITQNLNVQANRIEASQAGVDEATANDKQAGPRVEVLIVTSNDTISGIIRDSVRAREQKEMKNNNQQTTPR